jgi:hypothetical protein
MWQQLLRVPTTRVKNCIHARRNFFFALYSLSLASSMCTYMREKKEYKNI